MNTDYKVGDLIYDVNIYDGLNTFLSDLPFYKKWLPKNKEAKILELCCGTGRLTIPIAKDGLEARVVVSNWMSTRFTLEFLGIWEEMYNPNFNRVGFHTIKNADGRLVLTPKRWVECTNAIGIFSKSGRYGGGFLLIKILPLSSARG